MVVIYPMNMGTRRREDIIRERRGCRRRRRGTEERGWPLGDGSGRRSQYISQRRHVRSQIHILRADAAHVSSYKALSLPTALTSTTPARTTLCPVHSVSPARGPSRLPCSLLIDHTSQPSLPPHTTSRHYYHARQEALPAPGRVSLQPGCPSDCWEVPPLSARVLWHGASTSLHSSLCSTLLTDTNPLPFTAPDARASRLPESRELSATGV